jgi:hypothetical protein
VVQGNAEMEAQIGMHLRVPPVHASSGSEDDQRRVFGDYLYLTQVQQARYARA